MKNIYIYHSSSFDFKNELYKPIRESELNKKYNFILPHENKIIDTKQTIKEADLIIAEVSFPSTGQGIELGWANILNKKIICIYKDEHKYSSALKFITNQFYNYNKENLVTTLENFIRV
jgi:nucleoside 2-deoxyribosyltransferase